MMSYGQHFLPSEKKIGIQLGLGVSDSNLYVTSTDSAHSEEKPWLFSNDYKLSKVTKLGLVPNSRTFLCDSPRAAGNGGFAEQELSQSELDDCSDESLDESLDEDEYYELQKTFLARNHWGDIIPEMSNSLKFFRDVDVSTDPTYETKNGTPLSPQDYVPEELISTLTHQDTLHIDNSYGFMSEQLKSGIFEQQSINRDFKIIDPTKINSFTIGGIHTTKSLRMNRDHENVIVFASGSTNSMLNIALMTPQTLDFQRNISEPGDNYEEVKKLKTLGTHKCDEVTCIDLKSPIKCIKIPELSPSLSRCSNLIFTITENSLHVIKVDHIDTSKRIISVKQYDPLPFIAFEEFPIVDVAFNPWDITEFAIVDSKGNWCLGNIPKTLKRSTKLKLSTHKRGTIFDAEEISSWRRIVWSGTHTRLLIMDRSKMVELDFVNKWQLEVVQAKTWSCIEDYKRVNDNYGVLLTSKEIIFLRTTGEQIERVISWKHGITSEDVSIKLTTQEVKNFEGEKDLFFVYIYSKLTTFVYVHTFSLYQDIFRSVGDSFLINVPDIKNGIDSIKLLTNSTDDWDMDGDSSDIFCSFYIRGLTSPRIIRYLVGNVPGKVLQSPGKHVHFADNLQDNKNEATSQDAHQLKRIAQYMEGALPDILKHYDPSQDFSNFQDYGYKLSEIMNNIIESWVQTEQNNSDCENNLSVCCLYDMTEGPGYFENVDEFNSLLQQFMEYYERHNISFTKISTASISLLKEPIDSLELFYNKLLQCWASVSSNSEILTKEIVKDIALQTTCFYRPSKISEVKAESYTSLPRGYQEIFDLWDNDDALDGSEELRMLSAQNRPQMSFSQPSQIPPTIRSSQPIVKRSQKPHRRPGLLTSQRMSQTGLKHSNTSNSADPPSSQQSSSLPDTMTPAFSLTSSSQPPIPMFSQSQSSQRLKKRKKRVGGFG